MSEKVLKFNQEEISLIELSLYSQMEIYRNLRDQFFRDGEMNKVLTNKIASLSTLINKVVF